MIVQYVRYFNESRPHQGIDQEVPGPTKVPRGDISGEVTAIYGWNADTQTWLAYFPDGVELAGVNDLTVLNTEVAYWVAISGPGDVIWEIEVNVD